MKIVPLVAVAALVALGGVALAKGGSGPSAGGITLNSQPFFNGLTPSQQNAVLAKLWTWYVARQSSNWPPSIQNPNMTNPTDLTSDGGGNFSLVIDAYQTFMSGNASQVAGQLDSDSYASLMAD